MTLVTSPVLAVALFIGAIFLSCALLLAFVRLALGPSLPDRVVALDLIAILCVGAIAAYDIATEQPVLLDVAMVLALVAFLGTVAFAHYLERKGRVE